MRATDVFRVVVWRRSGAFFVIGFGAAESGGDGDADEERTGSHESECSDGDDSGFDDAGVAGIHGHTECVAEHHEGCSEQSPAGEFT